MSAFGVKRALRVAVGFALAYSCVPARQSASPPARGARGCVPFFHWVWHSSAKWLDLFVRFMCVWRASGLGIGFWLRGVQPRTTVR